MIGASTATSNGMDMLQARLYELELRQREERANEVEAGKTEIGWGASNKILRFATIPINQRFTHKRGNFRYAGCFDGDIDRFRSLFGY